MNTNAKTTTPVEPEYEWGVQCIAENGDTHTRWGYAEDPRTTGVIDEDNEIFMDLYYCEVVAVGKRVKSPEIWEAHTPQN